MKARCCCMCMCVSVCVTGREREVLLKINKWVIMTLKLPPLCTIHRSRSAGLALPVTHLFWENLLWAGPRPSEGCWLVTITYSPKEAPFQNSQKWGGRELLYVSWIYWTSPANNGGCYLVLPKEKGMSKLIIIPFLTMSWNAILDLRWYECWSCIIFDEKMWLKKIIAVSI